MELTYTRVGDYYIPDLVLDPEPEPEKFYGKYGDLRREYIREHRPTLWASLVNLRDYDLLIIDDLGAERNTEYALEQMFSIIDSRYRCNKPLIVTTNLKLDELKHPPDLAHARIYDRILERCAPILFAGKNFREDNAASTKAAARQIITTPAASRPQTRKENYE